MEDYSTISTFFFNQFLALLPKLFAASIIAVICFVFAKILGALMNRLTHNGKFDATVARYIRKTVNTVIIVLAFVIVFNVLGFPMQSLVAVIAASGAAIALALRDNLANIASGIALMIVRPFKVNDTIDAVGVTGTVQEIGLMYTLLNTSTNARISIPNSKLINDKIVNLTANPTRKLELIYTVKSAEAAAGAKAILYRVVAESKLALSDPMPRVAMKSQTEGAVELLLEVWCHTPDYCELQYELAEAVKPAFDKEGVL